MRKSQLPKILLFALVIVSSLSVLFYYTRASPFQPPPIKTIIVDEDEQHDKRAAYIEQIHSSAPEDNWRKMDFDYSLKKASDVPSRGSNSPGIYGKWNEVGSNNQAGRTVATAYHRMTNQLYVAADGGQIWRSTLGSDDWQSLNDQLNIPSIHFLSKVKYGFATRLILGSAMWGSPGMMYSDNEGGTWRPAKGLESVASWGYIRRTVMKISPEDGIYVLAQEWDYDVSASKSSLYVSYDHANNFELLTSFPFGAGLVDVWTDPRSNSDVFVLANDTIYSIDNFGEKEVRGVIYSAQPERVYLAGAANNGDNNLYVLYTTEGGSDIFASNDDGVNWAYRSTLGFRPFAVNSFKASPFHMGTLYLGGIDAYQSDNDGETWNIINSWGEYYDSPEDKFHADIPSFDPFVDADGNDFLIINTDGGAYVSYDNLVSVRNLSLQNLRISQYYSSYTCRFAPQYTHAGSQDQGYQFSDDGDADSVIDYDQVISGDYGNIVSGDGGASVWMVYPTFAMYSPDANNNGGLAFWSFEGDGYQWLPKLMEDPDNPASVYVAGGRLDSGAHLIRLTYNLGLITAVEDSFDFSNGKDATISAMAYSPVNNDYRYVLTTERDFFYTTDAGATWTLADGFEGPAAHFFYGASIEPSNQTLGLLYIAGSGYSNPPVFVSQNNGESFDELSSGLPSTLVFDLAMVPNDSLLFAATQVGAFVCKTWEGKWYDIGGQDLPTQAYWSVDYIPVLKSARFASYGRGIWEFDQAPDVIAAFKADQLLVTTGDSVHFTDKSKWAPNKWSWAFNGGIPDTSSLQNPTVAYPATGIYDVSLVVFNETSSDTVTIESYIEVEESTATSYTEIIETSIYPNPATNQITISSESNIRRVEIWDYQGKLTYSKDRVSGQSIRNIHVQNLPSGAYILVLFTTSGLSTKKIIII
ncbi:MAG: hypothetical protein DRI69_02335 [Bacteroidetes bacterium]|nr:MAG: hypothetical protein DRI69_02335 [Bacteroidota bacterium]